MVQLQGSLRARNPLAAEWIRQYGGHRINDLSPRSKRAIHNLLVQMFDEGIPPRVMARRMAEVVELRPVSVERLHREYQSMINRGVKPSVANNLIGHRAARLARNRAMLIARTENQMALNAGQQWQWQIAVRDGLLDSRFVRREWMAEPRSGTTCRICLSMNGRVTTLDHPWMLPNGRFVLTPPAHPNCRCRMRLLRLH